MSILDTAVYEGDGYNDVDRAAAALLRAPLLTALQAVPLPDRAQWLADLIGGFHKGATDGLVPDPNSSAHEIGWRMSLLLTEEGHA